jgi:hypothetical protein
MYSGSFSADDAATFRRNAARFRRLDALARRVHRLEKGGDAAAEPADEE